MMHEDNEQIAYVDIYSNEGKLHSPSTSLDSGITFYDGRYPSAFPKFLDENKQALCLLIIMAILKSRFTIPIWMNFDTSTINCHNMNSYRSLHSLNYSLQFVVILGVGLFLSSCSDTSDPSTNLRTSAIPSIEVEHVL